MRDHAFDAFSRTVGADRRRAMLAVGAAGLATALTGAGGLSAKPSAGKKARKKCKKQKASCLAQVTTFCGPAPEADCKALLAPCCATCDVGTGVLCALTAIPSS